MSRVVTHRWNLEPQMEPPPVGAIISGPRFFWQVVEVLPVESRKYPNAFRGRLRPLGLHGLTQREREARGWWIYYPRPKVPK